MTDSPATNALPVPYGYGLIWALTKTMGWGGGYAAIRLASQACSFSWADSPLWRCIEQPVADQVPIDPPVLTALREALETMYGPRGGYGLSKRIGRCWWGAAQDDRLHPSYAGRSLLDAFGSTIVGALRADYDDPHARDFVTSYHRRLGSACAVAARALTEEVQIPCQVYHRQPRLLIRFPACPFCGNTRPQCGILYGVVTGLLEWLFAAPAGQPPESWRSWYTLSPIQADDHRLLVVFHTSP